MLTAIKKSCRPVFGTIIAASLFYLAVVALGVLIWWAIYLPFFFLSLILN